MNSRFQILLERFLICSVVTSLMLSIILIIKGFLNEALEPDQQIINWFVLLCIFVSGIIYMFVLEIFITEKTKFYVHIVFVVLYQIFLLFICFLTGNLNAPYALIPSSVIHYVLEASVNEMFLFHDCFIYDCEGKSGKNLIEYLFHNNYAASEFGQRLKKIREWLFVMAIVQFVSIILCMFVCGRLSVLNLVFIISFYISLFLLLMVIGMYNKETYYAFLGFDKISDDKRKIFKSAFYIGTLSLLLGFLLSSDNSLIKIDKIQEQVVKTENIQSFESPSTSGFSNFDLDFEIDDILPQDSNTGVFVEIIMQIIKWGFITVISVLLLVFFIKPFISEEWKQFWKDGKLIVFLKKFWNDFKDFFKVIFSSEKNNESFATVESKSFKESISAFLKGSVKSKLKKNEIDRLTKKFMYLIDWASKRNMKYTKNLAPAEFTSKITSYSNDPVFKSLCESVGNLYEKALYDDKLLSQTEEKQFDESIDNILGFKNI